MGKGKERKREGGGLFLKDTDQEGAWSALRLRKKRAGTFQPAVLFDEVLFSRFLMFNIFLSYVSLCNYVSRYTIYKVLRVYTIQPNCFLEPLLFSESKIITKSRDHTRHVYKVELKREQFNDYRVTHRHADKFSVKSSI